jgi:apolipoprotein N-acyltransferase
VAMVPLAPLLAAWAIVRQPRLSVPAIASGLAIVLSFTPFDLHPLVFVSMVPLMAIAREMSSGRAFLWGWLTGTVIIACGFYFIYQLLMVFGEMPWFAALPLHILFALYQGVQMGLFAALFSRLVRGSRLPLALLAPLAYVPVEFVCRKVFIFPWYIASSSYPFTSFVQAADLFGGFGLSVVVLAINGQLLALFLAWRVRRAEGAAATPWPVRGTVAVAALFAATVAYGVVRIGQVDAIAAAQPSLRVGLVEANIGIFSKADPDEVRDNMLIHQRMSAELEADGAELIVWPETAVAALAHAVSFDTTDDLEALEASATLVTGILPRDVTYFRPSAVPLVPTWQDDRAARTPVLDRVAVQRGFRVPLLFGILTARPPSDAEREANPPHPFHTGRIAYNTAVLVDGDGRVLGMYDKNVRLVFGEYVPLAGWLYRTFGFNFYELVPTAGDIAAGESVEVLTLPIERDGETIEVRIGALICYEDLIAAYPLALAELEPNMLINIINDGWFEESTAAEHHMDFSVLRAIEHRLPVIRATNTGISSIVDPVGRVVARTQITGAETLIEDVPVMPPPSTLYSRIGDILAWLITLGTLVALVEGRPRRRAQVG